jgi:NAD(P)-dependent dehydrogenase (short-subunit alcohol dehydrogenase family)
MTRGSRARAGLRGKTAVVTGAARGIGAALAVQLARHGAQLALVGLEPAELDAVAARCAQHGSCRAWPADVTDRARMSAVARCGRGCRGQPAGLRRWTRPLSGS